MIARHRLIGAIALTLASGLAGCAAAPDRASLAPACSLPAHNVTVTTQGARLTLRPGSTPKLQRIAAFSGEGGAVLSCKPSRGGLKRCQVLFEDVPGKGYGVAAKAWADRVVYPADEESPSVEVRVRFAPSPASSLNCS